MNKKILTVILFTTLMMLIFPLTVSVSSKIINIEDKIYKEEKIYFLCILYGKIKNLSEEMLYGEIHYIFDPISLNGIELIYVPPNQFFYLIFNDEDDPGEIPKASFRGYISNNYIIGMFSFIKM
jgi:hypothetical protein